MPSTYTPSTTTWHTVITMIDDSDTPDASNFNLSPQDLADNVAYVYTNYINGTLGGYYAPTGADGVTIGGTGLYATTELGLYPDGVQSITVTAGGTGYTTAPTVTISAPASGGVQATATATVVGGVVTAITITNPGTLYEAYNPPFAAGPTVTITGGGGTGAAATANVTMTLDVGAGATIRWDKRSAALFESGSGATWTTGSTATWATGGAASWQSGSTATFANGSTLNLQGTTNVSAAITIAAGGGILGTLSNWFFTYGNGIVIVDGTNPVFQTARTRTILQPTIPIGSVGTWTVNYFQIAATNDGSSLPFALTKLINGSQLWSITINAVWSIGHTAANPFTGTIYQVDVNGNKTAIATGTLATTGVTSGTLTVAVSGAPVVIDDSQYDYVLVLTAESGSGSQTIQLGQIQVNFGNITQLGQF